MGTNRIIANNIYLRGPNQYIVRGTRVCNAWRTDVRFDDRDWSRRDLMGRWGRSLTTYIFNKSTVTFRLIASAYSIIFSCSSNHRIIDSQERYTNSSDRISCPWCHGTSVINDTGHYWYVLTRTEKWISMVSTNVFIRWHGDIPGTAWLNRIAHFAVDILPLHNYKSDLAHLSDLYSLVIELYKYERWAKNI